MHGGGGTTLYAVLETPAGSEHVSASPWSSVRPPSSSVLKSLLAWLRAMALVEG